MANVLHIFTAPERGAPMVSHKSALVHQDMGIQGDRYFKPGNRRGPDYQLSLIEIENIDAFNAAHGFQFPPEAPRRNVVTSGIRLNDYCGKRLRIGGIVLEGLELCEPCGWLNERMHPLAVGFFVGRGGLRTRVISGGQLEVGATIEVVV